MLFVLLYMYAYMGYVSLNYKYLELMQPSTSLEPQLGKD